MIKVKTKIRPEEVRTGGEHVLFVEGSEGGSLDQAVLRALLGNTIRVEAMGSSFSLRSAAKAFAKHHPKYYFLIDRDHYDDEFVKQRWIDFPNPAEGNLLVWRRREIENYFLDPPFLTESTFLPLSCKIEIKIKLEKILVKAAQERLFLDVANSVISLVREEQKKTWIKHFTNPADFTSKEEAIQQLISQEEFAKRSEQVSKMLLKDALTERFETSLAAMTGGGETLTYGKGRWIEMISGKKVLPQLLNSGDFKVEDVKGRTLTGEEMKKEIMKDLAVKDVDSRPLDLVELQRLIRERVGGP